MKKIVPADKNKIDALREYVMVVLEAVGHPEAYVTDESSIWDFHPIKKGQEAWLKKVSSRLGFKVATRDYIWEVAEQVRAKQWSEW